MKRIKVGDFAVIAFIILASLFIYIVFRSPDIGDDHNRYVSIQVNGSETHRISLDESTEELIVLDTEFGRNVIEIKDNSVASIEADCPDQIDVLQGAIYDVGERIVCLPNRMLVEIVSVSDSESDLDVINQ